MQEFGLKAHARKLMAVRRVASMEETTNNKERIARRKSPSNEVGGHENENLPKKADLGVATPDGLEPPTLSSED